MHDRVVRGGSVRESGLGRSVVGAQWSGPTLSDHALEEIDQRATQFMHAMQEAGDINATHEQRLACLDVQDAYFVAVRPDHIQALIAEVRQARARS